MTDIAHLLWMDTVEENIRLRSFAYREGGEALYAPRSYWYLWREGCFGSGAALMTVGG